MGSALQPDRVVASLRRIFTADIQAGTRRRLPEYQRLFAGFEAIVAGEYARLCEEHGLPDELAPEADTRAGATESGAPDPVATGQEFGPFRLVREIGRGGMGIVWLAEDTRLPRRVALKVLPPHYAGSESLRKRFEREASLAARLDDPGICPIFEAGEVSGAPYIAMRFVDGDSLADLLGRARETRTSDNGVSMLRVPRRNSSVHGARTPASAPGADAPISTPSASEARGEVARVVHLIEKVARSLHVAHESGLVHRDVKPQNVMVTPDGDPVLLDFGLAREEEGDALGMTQTGTLLGTPSYMSPEQLLAQRVRLDRRTDVYSLGVTLYQCVTLRLPFEAPTAQALYQRILTTEAEDPRRINPAVPRDLGVVIATALEKDRERRYATALDLAEDLRRVRDGEAIRARPVGPFERLRRWADRNRATAAFAAALLVALSAGLATTLVLLGDARRERDDKELAWREEARQRNAAQAARAGAEKALRSARAVGLTAASAEAAREDGTLSLLLAVEAAQLETSPATVTRLHAALGVAHEAATITAHTGPVRAAEFSPSGDRVLSASADGTARVFDLAGRELATLRHAGPVYAAHFSPAGDLVITASEDGTARLWDVDGRERAVLRGHTGSVIEAAIAPSCDRVVTAGADGTARVYDLTGRELAVARGHEREIFDVAFAPNGQVFATAGADGTARLWNASGEPVAVCAGHERQVMDLCFSPGGDRLLTGSLDKTARLWTLDGKEAAVMQEGANAVVAVAFDAKGEHIVTASPSTHCRLWDATGRPLAEFDAQSSHLTDASFARAGGLVVCCGTDQTARVWDFDGTEVVALRGHRGIVRACSFSPDGRRIVTASDDGTVRIWELRPGEVAVQKAHEKFVSSIAWSPNGDRLLTTSNDGTARVWDADGRPVATLIGHTDWVRGGVFLPDGERVLTWSNDNTARLWERDGRPGVVFADHTDALSSGAVSPAGDVMATTSWDGTVRLWGVDGKARGVAPSEGNTSVAPSFSGDGELIVSIVENGGARICDRNGSVVAKLGVPDVPVVSANWSPDGTRVVTGDRRGSVRVWTRDGREERSFVPGPAAPASARFSPDGRLLAVTGADRIVRLTDAEGRVAATLQGHRETVGTVRWLRTGGPLLTIARSEIRLWNEDGTEVCVLPHPASELRAAAPDPAGRRIATGGSDGVLRISLVEPAELLALAQRRRTREFTAEERARYAALLGAPR